MACDARRPPLTSGLEVGSPGRSILPLIAAALAPACLSASPARDAIAVAACDWPEPPAEVAPWVDESWSGELGANVAARRDRLLDAAVQGNGVIHLCVRWSSTAQLTAAWRDQIEPSMQAWFNGWCAHLRGYGCFPFPYDGWAGSLPPDGSVMLSARTGPTAAHGWLLRRVWKEQRALRGW